MRCNFIFQKPYKAEPLFSGGPHVRGTGMSMSAFEQGALEIGEHWERTCVMRRLGSFDDEDGGWWDWGLRCADS